MPGKDDVLVCYDECFENSTNRQPRAYWLFAYHERDTNCFERPKPKFVKVEHLTERQSVFSLAWPDLLPTNGVCAVATEDQHAFELWRDGAWVGSYTLPVYTNAPPVTWWRVALTPVTATTDAAIATVVVFGTSSVYLGPR